MNGAAGKGEIGFDQTLGAEGCRTIAPCQIAQGGIEIFFGADQNGCRLAAILELKRRLQAARAPGGDDQARAQHQGNQDRDLDQLAGAREAIKAVEQEEHREKDEIGDDDRHDDPRRVIERGIAPQAAVQAVEREDHGTGEREHGHRLQHDRVGRRRAFDKIAQMDRRPHRGRAGAEIEQGDPDHGQLAAGRYAGLCLWSRCAHALSPAAPPMRPRR